MRLTVREFVEGYKEGRDHSAEEVQAAIRKQVWVGMVDVGMECCDGMVCTLAAS